MSDSDIEKIAKSKKNNRILWLLYFVLTIAFLAYSFLGGLLNESIQTSAQKNHYLNVMTPFYLIAISSLHIPLLIITILKFTLWKSPNDDMKMYMGFGVLLCISLGIGWWIAIN